jgi:hypothetical protein
VDSRDKRSETKNVATVYILAVDQFVGLQGLPLVAHLPTLSVTEQFVSQLQTLFFASGFLLD